MFRPIIVVIGFVIIIIIIIIIILLTIRFMDATKFRTLTQLPLLISCKLSFPIVGFKMSSSPTLALKSPNKIFARYLGNLSSTRSSSS
jgi:hypothetical protein